MASQTRPVKVSVWECRGGHVIYGTASQVLTACTECGGPVHRTGTTTAEREDLIRVVRKYFTFS